MFLNTNIGPERVEVIPVPLGTVQVPGAATAITAFVIHSDFAGAPTDVVMKIHSLSDFTTLFGTAANAGQGYWAVKGFFDNAGTGATALIINASPSAASGTLTTFTSGSDKVRDPASLAAEAFSGKSSAASGAAGSIADTTYTMDDNILAGSMLVQKGASKGAITVTAVSQNTVTASAGGFEAIATKVGDIVTDSGAADFLVTAVLSDTQITVSATGLATGAATVKTGHTTMILANKHVASATSVWAPAAPATSSGAGFLVHDDSGSAPQAVDSLMEDMLVVGTAQKQIASNSIQAGTTIQFANSGSTAYTYTPSTGVVQYGSAVNLSSVVIGSVFRDGAGNDFQITNVNDGADHVTIAELDSSAKPASLNTTPGNNAGGSIRNGATRIILVDSTFNAGTASDIAVYESATQIQTSASYSGITGTYFTVAPMLVSSDYVGTSADGKGLHALDTTDEVDLVCIPGIYSLGVQSELINYCTAERSDCFGLLAIPPTVTTSDTDTLVAQINIVSITNGTESSILTLTGGTNMSQMTADMVVEVGGNLYQILAVDSDNSELEVASTSISTTGSATVNKVSAVTYKDVLVNAPSTHVAWYFNHVIVDDGAGGTVQVDPVGHVAGTMARIDANTLVGGVSHAPAGIQFAQLGSTVGLQLSLSERTDGYPLRSHFINRITSFPGSGRVIFGAYTAGGSSVTADEQLIQVIRSILFMKNSLEPGLRGFIWENQDPNNPRKIAEALASFCRANAYLFPAGLPESQQFKVIEVTPTQTDLNQGLLRVRLQVRFNTAVRFIELDLEFPLPIAS